MSARKVNRLGIEAILADVPEVRATQVIEPVLLASHAAATDASAVLAVIDANDGGGIDTATVTGLGRDVPSIVLTDRPSEVGLLTAFERGASSVLVTHSAPELLPAAIRAVHAGHCYIDPLLTDALVSLALTGRPTTRPHGLTTREPRVLRLLPRGLTNREIGAELDISAETVKTHVKHALAKIDARDRVEAVEIIEREGLA